jgi:hypothetical protein
MVGRHRLASARYARETRLRGDALLGGVNRRQTGFRREFFFEY